MSLSFCPLDAEHCKPSHIRLTLSFLWFGCLVDNLKAQTISSSEIILKDLPSPGNELGILCEFVLCGIGGALT